MTTITDSLRSPFKVDTSILVDHTISYEDYCELNEPYLGHKDYTYNEIFNELDIKMSEKVYDDTVQSLIITVFNYLRKEFPDINEVSKDSIDEHMTKEQHFKYDNYHWAYYYFNRYLEEDKVIYLRKCYNLLETACNRRIVYNCASGYRKTYRKISRDRNCAWSRAMHYKIAKKELGLQMSKLIRDGYAVRMLTLTPRNFLTLDSDDPKSLMLVLKNFWRYVEYDIINGKKVKTFDMRDKIKGYWGVPEIVFHSAGSTDKKGNYYDKDQYNLHYHFMVLGKHHGGFIDKDVIQRAWSHCCDKYGNDKIKGSWVKNIGAPHLKVEDKYAKSETGKAVHYITKYLSKGTDISSICDRDDKYLIQKTIHDTMHGRDMIKRGGALRGNISNELLLKSDIEQSLLEYDSLDSVSDDYVKIFDNGVDILQISSALIQQVKRKKLSDISQYVLDRMNDFDRRRLLKNYKRMRKSKVKLCPVSDMKLSLTGDTTLNLDDSTDLDLIDERLRIVNNLLAFIPEEQREQFNAEVINRLSEERFYLGDLYKFSYKYNYYVTDIGELKVVC